MRAFVAGVGPMVSRLGQYMPPRYRSPPPARRSSWSPKAAQEGTASIGAIGEVLGTGATVFRVGRVTVARPANTDDLDCRLSRAELWTIALLAASAVLVIVGTGAAEMWGMR